MSERQGRWYDELAVGDTWSRQVRITDAHLDVGAEYVQDFHPLHVDEAFARKSRYGSRILHGMLTSALMGGPVGEYFHGTATAYLEHNTRFLAPVKPGDTLTIAWIVDRLVDKPHHHGGIVEMSGTATNQDRVVAAKATGKIMVLSRPKMGSDPITTL
ncbi:MAG TPA: MaoC/PaaZ C-terminal domain-containing protein [Casimicrobiaceae bacterium]|nr:MaoC/PaaZ C-terminal domain-containing protein [Casimicrobiaceae bacterium]